MSEENISKEAQEKEDELTTREAEEEQVLKRLFGDEPDDIDSEEDEEEDESESESDESESTLDDEPAPDKSAPETKRDTGDVKADEPGHQDKAEDKPSTDESVRYWRNKGMLKEDGQVDIQKVYQNILEKERVISDYTKDNSVLRSKLSALDNQPEPKQEDPKEWLKKAEDALKYERETYEMLISKAAEDPEEARKVYQNALRKRERDIDRTYQEKLAEGRNGSRGSADDEALVASEIKAAEQNFAELQTEDEQKQGQIFVNKFWQKVSPVLRVIAATKYPRMKDHNKAMVRVLSDKEIAKNLVEIGRHSLNGVNHDDEIKAAEKRGYGRGRKEALKVNGSLTPDSGGRPPERSSAEKRTMEIIKSLV